MASQAIVYSELPTDTRYYTQPEDRHSRWGAGPQNAFMICVIIGFLVLTLLVVLNAASLATFEESETGEIFAVSEIESSTEFSSTRAGRTTRTSVIFVCSFTVNYTFTVDDQLYEGGEELWERTSSSSAPDGVNCTETFGPRREEFLPVPQNTSIFYNPADPERFNQVTVIHQGSAIGLAVVGTMIALSLCFCAAIMIRNSNRK